MSDIEDPFRQDSVVRPRPGVGRRGGGAPPPSRASFATLDGEPLPDAAGELLGAGLNPLVRAASSLLLLSVRLRHSVAAPEIAGLRRHAQDEIRRFEERARGGGVPNETVLAARYAVCAMLDEAVLATPWGSQSEWAQLSLLVIFHREAWGGEKFFDLLERLLLDPSRHIDLLELQYLCLVLGFGGKYRALNDGASQLHDIQRTVYGAIRKQRGPVPTDLSIHWKGHADRRNPLIGYVPWWVVGSAALAVLALTFVMYRSWLGSAAAPVQTRLAQIGLEAFAAAAPAAPTPAGPTIKQLLAADEANGGLSVEENNGRTTVTLLAPALFASGSATTNPGLAPLLGRVASAFARVPGRVLVVGHTDDQPLHSLKFADNFELSRERARSVVQILQSAAGSAIAFDSSGAGSSQPRYQPASDAANRARNRRVEMIHVAGA